LHAFFFGTLEKRKGNNAHNRIDDGERSLERMNISRYEATVNDGVRSDDPQGDPVRIYPNHAFLGAASDRAAAAPPTANAPSNGENDDGGVAFASSNDDDRTDPSRTTSVGPHLLGGHAGDDRDGSNRMPPAGIPKPRDEDVLLGRGGRFVVFASRLT
jgi:hypothetical protein